VIEVISEVPRHARAFKKFLRKNWPFNACLALCRIWPEANKKLVDNRDAMIVSSSQSIRLTGDFPIPE